MRLTKNLGMLLLGIWLIVTGLLQVVSIPIPGIGTILAVLAIAAGVLILLGRERQRLLLSPALQHHREVKPSARRQGRRVPFEETEGRSSRIHSGFVLTWTRPLCITWCGRAELGLLMRWYLGRKQVCPEIPTTAVRLTWVGHQLKRSPP